MNTASLKAKYSAALIGGFMVLICPCTSSLAAEKTVHQVIAPSGKRSAPVEIAYTVPESASIGASVSVLVTVTALADVTDLGLSLTPGEGLSLSGGTFEKSYGAQSRGAVISETVTVTPNTNGLLYLNVFASAVVNGHKMVDASAVPISVGPSTEKMQNRSGATARDASGQNIVIMPADEGKH